MSTRGEESDSKTVRSFDERTLVETLKRVDSFNGEHDLDIEKALAQQIGGTKTSIKILDGGWEAWLTVIGAWCICFSTFGMINAFGVYQDFYVRVYLPSYSPSTIGWIGSTQLFFQASMGFFAGKIFDAGYFYYMVPLSSLLYVFAYFMLSLAQQDAFYQIFLSQGVAAGISFGFVFLPAIGVLSHHFRRHLGLAIGIVTSGAGCGGLVFPFILNKLIVEVGFAAATRAAATLCTFMMVLACLLMRTRFSSPSKSSIIAADDPNFSRPTIKQLIQDTRYMLAIAGMFTTITGIYCLTFYFQLYTVVHGIDQNLAFYVITIFNSGSIIGRIIPNFLSNIWGPLNIILVSNLCCAILVFATLFATNAAGIVTIAVLYGIFSGAFVSLISPLTASLANGITEIGIRLGFAFTIIAFGTLIGIPISGALLTDELLWPRMLCFSGSCMICGSGFLFASKYLTVKDKGTWKI